MPILHSHKNLKTPYNMSDPENNDTLKDALKAYGLKQDIRRIHHEMMRPVGKKVPVRSLFTYANRVAAAILVLIFVGGILVFFTSTPSNLFNSRYEPYQESAQRGSETAGSAIKTHFLEGQKMLQEGKAVNAINIFADIIARNKQTGNKIMNDDAEFYLGLAYLKANQAGNALRIFRPIRANKNHLYNDEVSNWFLLRVKIASWKE
jgi:hypothetical protein